ncbi:phage minor capsid protein [Melghirimyces algeriensis]|uniref:Phage minor capsid protein 2 n=1 Tax=Melghirimyces algeriensis TaxID=910412 RepID=A0A521FBG6_9BACL|nr:phage minor capsid protein [Melghirimyces algeriensis]SMO92981.1 Phage minor capsid protein 2 [Melghirimyces algeriensis]
MRIPPKPNYEYEVDELVRHYQRTIREILAELERFDLTDYRKENARALLMYISELLADLNENAAAWVKTNIPKAAQEGVSHTIYELGVVPTLTEANRMFKFNRPNKEAIEAIVADTQADLLAVTQNVERKVRSAVRQVTAEVMRHNLTRGLNGVKGIRSEILFELRKRLGDSVNTGIIDAAGRRWKPRVYVDMLSRTKLMETYHTAKINEALGRGAYLALISAHGAKDACRFHEGRIMKLSPNAPGNYPTYDELHASGQIWHPRCAHTFTTFMSEEYLPADVKRKAERQAERGERALATGGRDPKID